MCSPVRSRPDLLHKPSDTSQLAERGIHLSPAQVYRLVTHTPERLSLDVLAALCDILGCGPGDLIVPHAVEPARRAVGEERLGDLSAVRDNVRPRRARIVDLP